LSALLVEESVTPAIAAPMAMCSTASQAAMAVRSSSWEAPIIATMARM